MVMYPDFSDSPHKIPYAKATIYIDTKNGPKEKKITLKQGTDVGKQTNRPGYDGYIVTNICAEEGLEHVEFANGKDPDWAVVTEHDEKLYLVRETKSTHDRDSRRETENRKVDCGRAHFDALGINFKVATSIHGVLAK